MTIKTAIAIALASTTSLGLSAHASTSDAQWEILKSDETAGVVSIVAESETVPDVFVTCKNDRLTVGINMGTDSMRDTVARSTNRLKLKRATTAIGDKRANYEPWVFMPSLKIAHSRAPLTGKRLYNAMIRGDQVAWQLDGKQEMTITFPEMNEAFKTFAKDCSVTSG